MATNSRPDNLVQAERGHPLALPTVPGGARRRMAPQAFDGSAIQV